MRVALVTFNETATRIFNLGGLSKAATRQTIRDTQLLGGRTDITRAFRFSADSESYPTSVSVIHDFDQGVLPDKCFHMDP